MGDRAVIKKVIAAVNDTAQRSWLITEDIDSSVDFDRPIELHIKRSPALAPIGMAEPWRELTVSQVVSGCIRFLTPDVAIVEADSTVRGAVTLARTAPLLFVMKRKGTEWKIAIVRVLTNGAVSRHECSQAEPAIGNRL